MSLVDLKIFLDDSDTTDAYDPETQWNKKKDVGNMTDKYQDTIYTVDQLVVRLEYCADIYCVLWQMISGHQSVERRMELLSRTDFPLPVILDAISMFGVHSAPSANEIIKMKKREAESARLASIRDPVTGRLPDPRNHSNYNTAVLEKRSHDLDYMQLNTIFHLMELLGSACHSPNPEYRSQDYTPTVLMKLLIESDVFFQVRVKCWVMELTTLLVAPHTSAGGVLVYMYATLLAQMLSYSGDLRECVRKHNHTEFAHTLNKVNLCKFWLGWFLVVRFVCGCRHRVAFV